MISGSRNSDVALEVGVNRTTIWRWHTDDPVFEAELNRRHHELWNASIERLRSLVPIALEVLLKLIELGGHTGRSRLQGAFAGDLSMMTSELVQLGEPGSRR